MIELKKWRYKLDEDEKTLLLMCLFSFSFFIFLISIIKISTTPPRFELDIICNDEYIRSYEYKQTERKIYFSGKTYDKEYDCEEIKLYN